MLSFRLNIIFTCSGTEEGALAVIIYCVYGIRHHEAWWYGVNWPGTGSLCSSPSSFRTRKRTSLFFFLMFCFCFVLKLVIKNWIFSEWLKYFTQILFTKYYGKKKCSFVPFFFFNFCLFCLMDTCFKTQLFLIYTTLLNPLHSFTWDFFFSFLYIGESQT